MHIKNKKKAERLIDECNSFLVDIYDAMNDEEYEYVKPVIGKSLNMMVDGTEKILIRAKQIANS